MSALLERSAEREAAALACPSWCTAGDRHDGDRYHCADIGEVEVGTTVPTQRERLRVSMGALPGQAPTILVSSDGFNGFEGDADVMDALVDLLVCAMARADADKPSGQICHPVRPEHCAQLAEGEAAAWIAAEALEPIVGHPVEITADADHDDDCAVLLYPSDVRRLLELGGA